MLFDVNDLLTLIKKTALEAVNASKPANMIFGKVVSVSPLKIKVDQKLILTSAQLVLSKCVTNHILSVTLDGELKTMTVNNALNINEEVIMMQVSGGQKYIVIDRIGKG